MSSDGTPESPLPEEDDNQPKAEEDTADLETPPEESSPPPDTGSGSESGSQSRPAPVSTSASALNVEPVNREGLLYVLDYVPQPGGRGGPTGEDLEADYVSVGGLHQPSSWIDPWRSVFEEQFNSTRRIFGFAFPPSAFMAGEFTAASLEGRARELLRILVTSRKACPERFLIFSADEFGSIIVKIAIAIAAQCPGEWPGIFESTQLFLFRGCLHRDYRRSDLERRIRLYLDSVSLDDRFIAAADAHGACVRGLADAITTSQSRFFMSKILHKAYAVSIFSSGTGDGEDINTVFVQYQATLGAEREWRIAEKAKDGAPPDHESAYPGVEKLRTLMSYSRSTVETSSPLAETLLSLVPPPLPLNKPQDSLDCGASFLASPVYNDWKAQKRPEILYVCGTTRAASLYTAREIVIRLSDDKHAEKLSPTVIYFPFDRSDSRRSSIKSLMAARMARSYLPSSVLYEDAQDQARLLSDQALIQKGWTEKDLLMFWENDRRQIAGEQNILLLEDFDRCESTSRRAFLDMIRSWSSRFEQSVSIIVTSQKPNALLDELEGFHILHVEDANLQIDPQTWDAVHTQLRDWVKLSGDREVQARIDPHMEALAVYTTNDPGYYMAVTQLIQARSGFYGDNLSTRAMYQFADLVERAPFTGAMEDVLDFLLRDIQDQKTLHWLLTWLLYGYKSLSKASLSSVLRCLPEDILQHEIGEDHAAEAIPVAEDHGLGFKLDTWLSGMLDEDTLPDAVRLSAQTRATMKSAKKSKYLWNDVKATAHDQLLRFCLAHLDTPQVQSRLRQMLDEYASRAESSPIAPGLCAPLRAQQEGDEITLYAVEAWPFHLIHELRGKDSLEGNEALSQLKTPEETLILWAQAHWALSNPFERPRSMPTLFWPTLSSLDPATDAYSRAGEDEEGMALSLAELAKYQRRECLERAFGEHQFSRESLLDILAGALSGGDEETALLVAERVVQSAADEGEDIQWPTEILWRCAWLEFPRLARLILSHGADPGTITCQDGAFPPLSERFGSPLILAAQLGHAEVVSTFLENTNLGSLSRDETGGLLLLNWTAYLGQAQVVDNMISQDLSLLEAGQPSTALYWACALGNYATVEVLLGKGADPSLGKGLEGDADEWVPLRNASSRGYVRCVTALLEHATDPGWDPIKQLAFGDAASAGHVDVCRLLARHGAVPTGGSVMHDLFAAKAASDDVRVEIADLAVEAGFDCSLLDSLDYGQTPLVSAIKAGRAESVDWLLRHGADVNLVDNSGETPLFHAVAQGTLEVLKMVLERDPALDTLTSSGEAVWDGAWSNEQVLELLLDRGMDPNLCNSAGETLLMKAAEERQANIVSLLIGRKADVNQTQPLGTSSDNEDFSYGWSALAKAVYADDAVAVRLLLDAGADVNFEPPYSDGGPIIHEAMKSTPEVLRVVLEYRQQLDIEKRSRDRRHTALSQMEVYYLKDECVKMLVRAGADINATTEDGPALSIAIKDYREDLAMFLLSQPDINVQADSTVGQPINLACRYRMPAVVCKLLELGASPNASSPEHPLTPLRDALFLKPDNVPGNLDVEEDTSRILIDAGADVNNVPDPTLSGRALYSPICTAVFCGFDRAVDLLVRSGAQMDVPDIMGRLPLHFAATRSLGSFRDLLLASGDMSNAMRADITGKTPLHWAAQYGVTDVVEHILSLAEDARSHVDVRDSDGWTPLGWAVRGTGNARDDHAPYTDFFPTVQHLMSNGANPFAKFSRGDNADPDPDPDDDDVLTPYEVAKRYRMESQILELMEDHPGHDAHELKKARRYYQEPPEVEFCDVCFTNYRGIVYRCQSCPWYFMCKKCYRHVDEYHGRFRDKNGEPHRFELYSSVEFEDPTTPSPPPSSRSRSPAASDHSSTSSESESSASSSRASSTSGRGTGRDDDGGSERNMSAEED